MQAAAERLGKDDILVESEHERWHQNGSDWVLMSSNRDFLNLPKVTSIQTPWPDEGPSRIEWTDVFSNVTQLIDWRD
jgi:hypothetical protein